MLTSNSSNSASNIVALLRYVVYQVYLKWCDVFESVWESNVLIDQLYKAKQGVGTNNTIASVERGEASTKAASIVLGQ